MPSYARLLSRMRLGLLCNLILLVHIARALDDAYSPGHIADRDEAWPQYKAWDHSNDTNITAEADILWPREGETFALNDKGMAMIFAIQNYAEAQKHDWYVDWTMCMNRTDKPGRRICTQREPLRPYDRGVLRNDSAKGDEGGDVYIEINHSYWYSKSAKADFDYTLGGIYDFEWKFGIGATCEFTNTSMGYLINEWIASGSFVVTLDPAATYPTPTPTTCGSYLGAVEYAGTTTYDFRTSVANSPGCVVTNPVTATPAPCRATLDAAEVATVASFMNWNGSNPNATAGGASATTAKSSAPATDNQIRFALASAIIALMIECYL